MFSLRVFIYIVNESVFFFQELLEVIVEAWDHNPMNSPDHIARFRGQLVVAETPNTASKFKIERDDVRYVNNFR